MAGKGEDMSHPMNDQPCKTLASQLDRLDGILDALSDGLNQAVLFAVQQALERIAGQVVKTAVLEAPREAERPSTSAIPSGVQSMTLQRVFRGSTVKRTRRRGRHLLVTLESNPKGTPGRRLVVPLDVYLAEVKTCYRSRHSSPRPAHLEAETDVR